jgi:hypothetical protein
MNGHLKGCILYFITSVFAGHGVYVEGSILSVARVDIMKTTQVN